jgi:hypothetical protein
VRREEFTPVDDDSTVSCVAADHCGEDATVVLGSVISNLSFAGSGGQTAVLLR